MALKADPYFGFDLIQRKTLAELLEGIDPAVAAEIDARFDALEARVTALENA